MAKEDPEKNILLPIPPETLRELLVRSPDEPSSQGDFGRRLAYIEGVWSTIQWALPIITVLLVGLATLILAK